MSFFYVFVISILIGASNILPGVSGGVVAVIFGIYDKIIFSINNLFKSFRKNFLFLFITALGIIIGMLLFGNVLLKLYKGNELITKSIFIGAILGGIPCLRKLVKSKTKHDINFPFILIFLVLSLSAFYIVNANINFNIILDSKYIVILFLLIGFIYSAGKVIPGISGALILILFNQYEYILKLVSNPLLISYRDSLKLLPFIIGFTFGCIFFIKLMNTLMKYNFRNTYSAIIGIILGTIPAFKLEIYDVFSFLLCFVIILLTSYFTYKVSKTE